MVAEPLPFPMSKLPQPGDNYGAGVIPALQSTDQTIGIIQHPDKFGPGVGGPVAVRIPFQNIINLLSGGFSIIAVPTQSNIVAETAGDTLNIVAGSGISIATDAGTDTLTISSTATLSDGDKGDITVSSSGSVWTIDNGAVTYGKIQDVSAASRLLGRGDSGSGDVQEITLGTNLSMSGTTLNATGGGGSTNAFGTIVVSGQSDVVADAAPDTLTLVAGSNVTITTNAGSDSITIAAASPSNSFSTIVVSGQSDVVADSSSDTLTLVAGSNVTITTNAGSDTITIASSVGGGGTNAFGTIVVSGQSDVVADAAPDTLTLVAGTNITITTDAGADSITISATGGGGAPTGAQYLVLALDGTLSAERVLVAGNGLTGTDGGANGNFTLAVGAGSGITVAADTVAVDFATTTEVLTGTSTTDVVNPDALAAIWEKGSNVASAATISLGEGGFFHITGTTTITDIDFATPKDGRTAILVFDGALTLTHNATTLILPGGANITTVAGDSCCVVQDASDNVKVVWYQRVSGAPIGAAPVGAQYVVLATDTTLTNERVLVAGAGLTGTDGGAGGNFTVAVGAGSGITVNADDVALNITGLSADTPVSGDEFPFFDISGSDNNKVTLANLAGALVTLNAADNSILFRSGSTIAGEADLSYNSTTNTITLASNGTFTFSGGVTLRNSGTSLAVGCDAATTNDVVNVVFLNRTVSGGGTPTAGVGAGLAFQTETSAGGNTEIGGVIASVATDVTSSSEDFDLRFSVMSGGNTAAERLRLDSEGDVLVSTGTFTKSFGGFPSRVTIADFDASAYWPLTIWGNSNNSSIPSVLFARSRGLSVTDDINTGTRLGGFTYYGALNDGWRFSGEWPIVCYDATGSIVASRGLIQHVNTAGIEYVCGSFYPEIGTGSLGIGAGFSNLPERTLHPVYFLAETNTVQYILRLGHWSTGTPTAGIGAGIEFQIQTASGNREIAGAIETTMTNVGSNIEASDIVFRVMDGAGVLTEGMRVGRTSDWIELNIGKNTSKAEGGEFTLWGGGASASQWFATWHQNSDNRWVTQTFSHPWHLIASGGLFIGSTTKMNIGGNTANFTVNATSVLASNIPRVQIWSDDDSATVPFHIAHSGLGAPLLFSRTAGATPDAQGAVADAATVGRILWIHSDGTNFGESAMIRVVTSGAATSGSTPAAMQFYTTPSGADDAVMNLSIAATGKVAFTNATFSAGGFDAIFSDAGFDVLAGWDDSAATYKSLLLADIATEGAPAAGDFVIVYGAEGDLRKVNWSSLPGAGGGISNVVEDTTPQLGGDLDLNGNSITTAGGVELVGDGGAGLVVHNYIVPSVNDANNNTVSRTLLLQHDTTGTPGAGIGVGMSFEVETAADHHEIIAQIDAVTTDVTDTTEDGDLSFRVMAAGTIGEKMRLLSTGVLNVNGFANTFSDAGFDVVYGWDDSAGTYKSLLLADIATEATPAAGDFLILYGAEGDLRKVDWDDLPAGGGGSPAGSDGAVQYKDGSVFGGSANDFIFDDTLGRVGIGLLGRVSPQTRLHVEDVTGDTNNTHNIVRLSTGSTGTPATGIGIGVQFEVENAAGTYRLGGHLELKSTDVTDTSEDFDFIFSTMAGGATAAERLRISGTTVQVAGGELYLHTGTSFGFVKEGNMIQVMGLSTQRQIGFGTNPNSAIVTTLRSDMALGWTTSSDVRSDQDIAMTRLAAGQMRLEGITTQTNAVSNVLRLRHSTTGTAANGIGLSIEFEQDTGSDNYEIGARIEAVTTDVGSGSEDFDLRFYTMAGGAAVAEGMRLDSTKALLIGGTSDPIVIDHNGAAGAGNIGSVHVVGADINIGRTNGNVFIGATNGGNCHAVLGDTFRLRSVGVYGWSSNSGDAGAAADDTRLDREAAGVVRVNPPDFSSTNTVEQIFTLRRTSSSTPATGIGVGMSFDVETAADNIERGMAIQAVTTDVGSGTEDFDFVLRLMQNGAAHAERFRVASSGAITASGAMTIGTSSAFTCGTIELGNASDTTISRDSAGVIAVEGVPLYSNTPQNSQSAAYTTVLADAQKHILHPTADNNARTFTIAANGSVAYPIGTAITFVNQINTVTIAINTDTLVFAGTGGTGSRTLAASGVATALKIASTTWIISGTGLT